MFYIVALAAGTFEPVKIFNNEWSALGAQLLAIVPTLIFSQGRIRYICLVQIFTFISSFFAVFSGSGAAALVTAAFPYLLAIWAKRKEMNDCASRSYEDDSPNFGACYFIGAVGVWLPLLAMCIRKVDTSIGIVLAFSFLVMSVLPILRLFSKSEDDEKGQKISSVEAFLQIFNTTAALGITWFFFKNVSAITFLQMEIFYGVAAGTLFFWAIAHWVRFRAPTFCFQLFFVKANLMLSLFLAELLDKNALWLSLTAQCLALAWSGRATKSKWTFIPLALAWFAAYAFWQNSSGSVGLEKFAFVVGTLLTFGWAFGSQKIMPSILRRFLLIAFGIVSGALFFVVLKHLDVKDEIPGILIFAGTLIFASGIFLPRFGKSAFLAAAGTLFVGMQVYGLEYADNWITVALAIALSAISIFSLKIFLCKREELERKFSSAFTFVDALFFAPALLVLTKWLAKVLSGFLSHGVKIDPTVVSPDFFLLLVISALIPLFVVLLGKRFSRSSANFAPLALLVIPFIFENTRKELCSGEFFSIFLPAFLLCGLLVEWSGNLKTRFDSQKLRLICVPIVAALAVCFSGVDLNTGAPVLLGLAVLFAVIRNLKIPSFGLFAGTWIALAGTLAYSYFELRNVVHYTETFFLFVAIGGLVFSWIFGLAERGHGNANSLLFKISACVAAAVGMLFGWNVLTYPNLFSETTFYTGGIAAMALAAIMLGLIFRSKPFRIVGIATLGIAISRLFIFDISGVITRIVAFAVVAVILILLSFVYHKISAKFGNNCDSEIPPPQES